MAGEARALYFNLDRCVGCHACETACKMENNISVGPKWIEVVQEEVQRADGTWSVMFMPLNCRHCSDPLCVAVCPTGAIEQGPDKVVLVDKKRCIGCAECLQACPFGAPQFGPDGAMEKCTLCAHRGPGQPTACEQLCPVGAISSGTLRDISTLKRKQYLVQVACGREVDG